MRSNKVKQNKIALKLYANLKWVGILHSLFKKRRNAVFGESRTHGVGKKRFKL